MPKDPPRPWPRPPIVEDRVEAPQVSDQATTAPPPADPREPPIALRAPRGRQTTLPRADTTDGTERKAMVDAVRAAEAARLDAEAKAAELAAELAASKKSKSEFDPVAYFTSFQVIALKFFLPLAAVLGAAGLAFSIWNKQTIEPKVDRTVVKQDEQAKTTGTVEDRVRALEKHARKHEEWARCRDAVRDSAIERGTGHRTESHHDEVQWIEQLAPKPVPRTLWKAPPWLVAKDSECGDEPTPPSSPP